MGYFKGLEASHYNKLLLSCNSSLLLLLTFVQLYLYILFPCIETVSSINICVDVV